MAPWMVAHVGRQLRQELNWRMLLQQAHRHAVVPLLRQNLQKHFWPQTPTEVRDYLTEACQRSQRRNLALTAELLRILTLLEKVEVAAIPFKGPVLAMTAYGSTALRTFGDLDILVTERDLTKACQVLAGQGYVPNFTLTPREERAYRRAECALQLRQPQRDVVVELHWLLTERYLSINLPIAAFWKRTVPAQLAGRPVLTFAPEDLLLYLCVHGCKHEWERLEWLSSIAALMEHNPNLNWQTVDRRARECGIHRLVKVTFLLVNALLQVPLPAPYRNEPAGDHAAEGLVREVVSKLFTQSAPKQGEPHNRGSWYLFLLRTRERWSDKARIITFSSLRLPHPAAEHVPLPSQLAFLHYVLRPVRLLRAAVALSWRYWMTERRRIARTSPASGPAAACAPETTEPRVLIH